MPEELSPQQCLATLADGEAAPLYYVWGEEEYLCEQVVKAIKQRVLEGGSADFNLDRFDAGVDTAATILDAVRTVPFLGSWRLVIVTNTEALADADAFHAYCNAPFDETCLVFTAVSAAKKRVHDLLRRTAVVVSCKRLKGISLGKWVADEAKRLKLNLPPAAAEMVIDLVGDELRPLQGELEKLLTYHGEGTAIGVEDVVKLVGDTRAARVFDLTDAAAEGRIEDALRIITKLFEARESAPGIVAMLARHFRLLWRTGLLLKQGAPPAALASKLGAPPFLARRYAAQVKKFNEQQLRRYLFQLWQTDQALKMSGMPHQLTLEKLLLDFSINGKEAKRATAPRT